MSVSLISQCPVCNNQNFKLFLTTCDFYVTGESFDIKQCTSCGMKITDEPADEEHIAKYYNSEKYIAHSDTNNGVVNVLYHLVRHYMLRRKGRLVERVSGIRKGNILDVGTGTGYFLRRMKKLGWSVTGTEKSKDARAFAEKKLKLQLLPDDQLFKFGESSFDVITLWHVLEHIHKLEENLAAFNRLIKPGGKLMIAVPNHTSFDARKYGKYWAAWDVPRHIWHFSPSQMRQVGDKFGFALKSMHNMPFDSFYVSILSEKYRKSKLPLIKGLLSGLISWLIGFTGKGRGSSVIYVFDKKA